MPVLADAPLKRTDLVFSSPAEDGSVVVKDRVNGKYFKLGAEEAFLFSRLNDNHSLDDICVAYSEAFDDSVTTEELREFIKDAQERGLLARPAAEGAKRKRVNESSDSDDADSEDATRVGDRKQAVNFLNWRLSLCDPDQFLSWLAPKLSFLWTPTFVALSLMTAVLALAALVLNFSEYSQAVIASMRWETIFLGYVVICLATALHEMAHGLTCKHHGGEVHEIGFLMLLFMPCLYCNVSDAWLIREKSKRIWITLAGTYCDLCVWALAVFAWRILQPGTLPYSLAVILISVCGVRVFLNFMPLIKLDGYYMFSDWFEIPNLRRKSRDYLGDHFRWLLWGAERPARPEKWRVLLAYGLASWLFYCSYAFGIVAAAIHFSWSGKGILTFLQIGLVSWLLVPRLFSGFSRGEITKMLLKRHKRIAIICGASAAALLLLIFVPVSDSASGPFQIRPASRVEVRAPVAGFLESVFFEEGEKVDPQSVIVQLDIPDLTSRQAQKKAEIKESQAKLTLLQAGTRAEELMEQREKVKRAKVWQEMAQADLSRQRKALEEELVALTKQVSRMKSELNFAIDALDRGKQLRDQTAMPLAKYRSLELAVEVARNLLEQAEAKRHERELVGTLTQEVELASREKAYADARGALKIMEAGTRPEEIQAEKARLTRLEEEEKYLQVLGNRIKLRPSIEGIVVTPRLNEKIGHYFKEGELICEIETPSVLEAEVRLEEQSVAKVRPGQVVALRARSLPWAPFTGSIKSIAPVALPNPNIQHAVQNSVLVTCALKDPPEDLRSGMTGHARISCGQCSLGEYLFGRLFRYIRTEVMW